MGDPDYSRKQVLAPGGGRVMTKQSMALESDVNQIVARHIAHREPFPDGSRATYGDFSGAVDFHTALNAVRDAEATFGRLPSAVREFCNNDPGEFLDLVHDEGRRADLFALGLVPEAVPAGVGGASGAVGAPPATPPAPAGTPAPSPVAGGNG